MKLIKVLTEQSLAGQLSLKISSAIESVDESLGYDDLALAIAEVIKGQYGTHLYEPFMDELREALDR